MQNQIDTDTARYIASLQAVPALDREQELALAAAFIERGDRGAADRLIAASLRHVVPMALRYRHLGVPVADLIAQGSLGLMEALRRFDVSRELRFVTYAKHWVRSEMLSLVLSTRHMVGGGRGELRSVYAFRMRGEHTRLQAQFGSEGEVLAQLAERYGRTMEDIERILARVEQRDASLDAALSADGTTTLLDQLSSEQPDYEAACDEQSRAPDFKRALAAAKTELDERERYIVEHRLMADEETQLSLHQLGQHFGVSRERVRQLEQRVKNKLRQRLAQLATHHEITQVAA